MAATDTPIKKTDTASKRAAKPAAGETPLVADQNARMRAGEDDNGALNKEAAEALRENADAMDALEPGAGDAMSKAIRATGGEVAGMGDVFGEGGGTIRERAARLTQRDFQDASQFAAMAMELSAYVPDLLLECYCIWLQVPTGERPWAKLVFEQPWDPENNKWGLKDEEHRVVIGAFVDQNYEELRGFFTEDLPSIARRVVLNEKARAGRESESAPSKPSSTSGQPEVATS
jgi:hypothetical protein